MAAIFEPGKIHRPENPPSIKNLQFSTNDTTGKEQRTLH
jgi:hypothetical protein